MKYVSISSILLRSLRGGLSSTLYHKVRALTLCSSVKYTLEKYVIS
jgi:hypothetical protein